MSTWTEQDSIALSAILVARDRCRMPLQGAERRAAVELMLSDGTPVEAMATRLNLSAKQLRDWCSDNNITLPGRRRTDWWVLVAAPSYGVPGPGRRKAAA